MRKTSHLQKHRLKAFSKTLDTLEIHLQRQISFIEQYDEVFHFPVAISRRNVRQYNRWLKAINKLKDIEQHHL